MTHDEALCIDCGATWDSGEYNCPECDSPNTTYK